MPSAQRKNSGKNTGPRRDKRGRLTGGNPGNSGGKPGRSGRPSNEFKDFLRECRLDPAVQRAFRRALLDPESRGFSPAVKTMVAYDEDKPVPKLKIEDVTGKAERLNAARKRVNARRRGE